MLWIVKPFLDGVFEKETNNSNNDISAYPNSKINFRTLTDFGDEKE
jgi:hypothetical protein